MTSTSIIATEGASPETKATSLPAVSGLSAPADFLRVMMTGGLPPLAGPAVTPHSAMSVPVVKACVELISGAIGALPVKVYKEAKGGGREEAPDHPAYALVHDDASDILDAGQLREQLVVDALLTGNGYGLVRRDDNGEPFEILRLPPEAVQILQEGATGTPYFRLTVATGHLIIAHGGMIHLPAPATHDGLRGTAPIHRARNAISLALAMEGHLSRIFAKGARPSGILSFPPAANVGPLDAANALKSFEAQTAGDRSGRPAVLFDGATWRSLEYSTVDLQFAEQRAAQTHEIARAFNVPPTMIGELAKATLSNSETMGRQFLRFTLTPWIRALSAAYRRTLIPREDRRAYTIAFETDGLIQPDSAERASYANAMRSSGVMTPNEVRAWLNLPARKDGDHLISPHVASPSTKPELETENV